MIKILHKRAAWQTALLEAVTDPEELFAILDLDVGLLPDAKRAAKLFPFRVSRFFLSLINKGDINDPLLRQFLPIKAELADVENFIADPLQEAKFNPLPGLLHKYKDRVLLTISGSCAINCRYCFRRNFPYQDNLPAAANRELILQYLATNKNINEVILSGGDPLMIPDSRLENWYAAFTKIAHIKRIRIHTRLPLTIPDRITDELINCFNSSRMQTIFVLHCNHANEISDEFRLAIDKLRRHKIVLLNQSVLLAKVNDSIKALTNLSEKLFSNGILPYYLHLPDKVAGTAHFSITDDRALELYEELRASVSGYLVPKLVREVPGDVAKTIISR